MRTCRSRLVRDGLVWAAVALCGAPGHAGAPAPTQSTVRPLEHPIVQIERVVNRSGNNPFDPRDPLAGPGEARKASR